MYEWIDNILIGLLETYGTNNVYNLYDFLNIEIGKLECDNILLSGNEALYFRNYFNKEIVFIRNDLKESYERFTLAHELGHALLHTNTYEAAFNKNLINIGKYEHQANYFALKLLSFALDPIEMDGFTLEQVSSYLELPSKSLDILTNIN